MKLTVIGSLNIDHYSFVHELPRPGETVPATRTHTSHGGKGANQAIAAARAGAAVRFIGMIGDDHSGLEYLGVLASDEIDTSGISQTPRQPTGAAFIAVDSRGENSIIVSAGANGCLTPDHIETHRDLITSADAILLQFESPMATVLRATSIAAEAGIPVFLNPSPMPAEVPWEQLRVSAVIVNETEFARLPAGLDARIIVTRGSGPTTLSDSKGDIECPAFNVAPVDTVGAGDTFAGVIATVLTEGMAAMDAIRFANAAAALATLGAGAQEAIPQRSEIASFLESNS